MSKQDSKQKESSNNETKVISFGHTSDWHLGRRHMNLTERYNDNFDAVKKVIRQARIQKIDFLVHSGDLFEHASPTARTYNYTFRLLSELKKANIPIYVIRGNHDASAYRLQDNSLHVLENAGYIHLIENDVVNFDLKELSVSIYGLSYAGLKYDEELQNLIKNRPLDPSHLNILLLHASVAGFKFSDNRPQLNDEDQAHFTKSNLLTLGFDYIALGHHHRTAIETKEHSIIAYSGATEHWNRANWEKDIWTVDKSWLKIEYSKSWQKPKIQNITFPVRHKQKYEFDLREKSVEVAKKVIWEKLKEANQHPGGMIDYTALLGFNQIDHNNPFYEWTEKIDNLLAKACIFKIYDKEISDATFNALSVEEIIENYLDNNYEEKKDFFSDLVKTSLSLFSIDQEKDGLIERMSEHLEGIIDANN